MSDAFTKPSFIRRKKRRRKSWAVTMMNRRPLLIIARFGMYIADSKIIPY